MMIDPPVPSLDQRGNRGLHGVPHAGQVDVDQRVDQLGVGLLVGRAEGGADPGVGAHDIDVAEFGQTFSAAAVRVALSRTSATRATMPRPVASTRRAVSARSSSVAIG